MSKDSKIKKKSISPIISVILLIVIAVVMVTIILTWGKTTTVNNLEKAKSSFNVKTEMDCAEVDLIVSNVVIDSVTKDLNFTLENKSDIKIGGIIISIFGYTYDGNYTKLEGIFEEYIDEGEIRNYSTVDSSFSYTTFDDLNYFDVNSIDFILFTNSTCVKNETKFISSNNGFTVYDSLKDSLVAEFLLDGSEYTFKDQELLVNNSFDYNLDSWTPIVQGDSQVIYDDLVYYSEPGSVRIDIEDDWAQLDQTVNVISNTKYNLSFKFLSTTGNISFRIKDDIQSLVYNVNRKEWIDNSNWTLVHGDKSVWNDYNISFFTHPNSTSIRITLYYDRGQYYNKFYFDDISLKPISISKDFKSIVGLSQFRKISNLKDKAIDFSLGKGHIIVDLGSGSNFSVEDSYSYFFWIKFKDLERYQSIFSRIYNPYSYMGPSGISDYQISLYDGITSVRARPNYSLITTDSWVNFIFIVDRDLNKTFLYQDNILVSSLDISNLGICNSGDLIFSNNSIEHYFDGFISDFRFYSKKLTIDEINNVYNSTKYKYLRSPIPNYKDLILHIDANSMSDYYNDGDYINYFNDLSPVNNDLKQDVFEYRPIYKENIFNGLPAIRFNGNVDSFLETKNNTGLKGNDFDLSVFVVVKLLDSAPAYSTVISQNYSDSYDSFSIGVFGHNNGRASTDQWSPSGRKGSTILNLDEDYLLSYIIPEWNTTSTTTDIYVNGLKESSSSYSIWNTANLVDKPFRIGNWEILTRDDMTFPGDVAEIMVYNRALEDSERIEVENYLKNKYNIE